MEQYPLLFFPYAIEDVKVGRRRMVPRRVSTPNAERQSERLTPVFQALCSAVESMTMHVQDGTDGLDPETVLVLKTVGTVDDFANAVKRINGMEWLGEFDVDDIAPDDDFFDVENPETPLSGRLYMVSTNQEAIRELLTLWQRYQNNPYSPFDRGYSRFKEVFSLLKEVRRWNSADRFEGTCVKEYWQYQLDNEQDQIRFEIELWYKSASELLSASMARVSSIIQEMGGSVISSCTIRDIQYAALLVELPASRINELLSYEEVDLVKCEDIMFFRPSGQMAFELDHHDAIQLAQDDTSQLQAVGNPVIAIFDGYPMSNHKVLSRRLIIDDPDNYGEAYNASEMVHGTAMCSLIIKGDLTDNCDYITSPLYVRPIMKPNPHSLHREEYIPSDCLIVDVIHRAVKGMFEGENSRQPSAPTVKVINLSIGDPARMFITSMSPLAKLLDWLSYKYSVLFIISAGNHPDCFDLQMTEREYISKSRTEQERSFAKIIIDDRINRKILSPAESINGITVGAVHRDNSVIRSVDRRINPFNSFLPAIYSSFGSGHRGSVKPDLVFDGGRQTFMKDEIHFSPLRPVQYPKSTPGHLVASPGNGINDAIYSIGTSNSAALITRKAFFCHKTIEDLSLNHPIDNKYVAILIKAMIIHGCSWDEIGDSIESVLDPSLKTLSKKRIKTKWIGYGYPDLDKSLVCNPQRATVIGLGSIKKGKAEIYRFPIPECLNAITCKRRLTITLAWFSSISATNQKYRNVRFWFEVSGLNLTQTKSDVADENIAKRGTIQHEVFVSSNAIAVAPEDCITIKVTCDRDASNITEEIPYALMVSLEVAPGIDLPIYQEVRTKISTLVPIRV